MDKVRISEIAQEMGLTSKEVVISAQKVGFEAKAANSSVSPEQAENLMEYIMTGNFPGTIEQKPKKKPVKKATTKKKETTLEKETSKKEPKVEAKESKKTPKTPKTPKKEIKDTTPAPKAKRKIEKINKKTEEVTEVKPKVKEEVAVEKEVVVEKKVEVKEEPVAIKQEKKEEPKEEVKVKEEQKPELKQETKPEIKPEIKKPTLAESSLKKRRGLVIVKKKKKEPVQKSSRKINDIAMPDIVPGAKKKRKVKKTAALGKNDNSQKIDIFGGDISSFELLGEEEMVVLHDFTVKDEPKKVEPTKRKNDGQNNRPRPSFVQNRGISRRGRKRRKPKKEESNEVVTNIQIPEDIRVYEFAEKLNRPISDIIKVLFTLGVMMTKNDFLDKDSIEILAEEFEVEVTTINPLDEFDYEKDYDQDLQNHEVRPPIITIMGHVDHGKTSLLDKIRSSRVASGEHGGITQHVGAYMVEKDGQNITFIDTPGHAAFSQMRARGASVTDIVIIVVAADDGVMPQTKEAVEHAKAANVPYMIAINKMDKESANPDMVKAGLAEIGVTPVDWGGDIEFINVSAHTGDGIEELLENIQIQAELLELQASKDAKAKSTVIECSVEKGRGPVATIIMENGTLNIGDSILCGSSYGRVKAILDENKKSVKTLLPGEPGVVVGLNQVPIAGDILISMDSEKEVKELATKKADYLRQKELSKSTKVTLDDLGAKIAEGKMKSLPVILKADVGGSLEALKATLAELRNDEVKVNIISSGVGGITESDIAMSEASDDVVILGFNIRPTGAIKEKAKRLGVRISTYNVIYDLIDDVTALLSGMLSPIDREENLGQAEVRDVFKVPKLGQIAGCIVSDGSINKGAGVRVIRAGVVIFEGEISSLKRFKDDVNEVKKGYECGIGVVGYSDIKAGDFLESFKIVQDKATL